MTLTSTGKKFNGQLTSCCGFNTNSEVKRALNIFFKALKMTSPQDFSLSTFHKSATEFTGLGLRTTGFSGRLAYIVFKLCIISVVVLSQSQVQVIKLPKKKRRRRRQIEVR